jgi:DeoR family transcriptional regulator, copper-sensing transcriptional repressor
MSHTPAARQRHILELLETRHLLTIQELATDLGVSALTVHRDLNKLADNGRLVKTRGGVALPAQAHGNANAPAPCAMCNRLVSERSAVILQGHRLGRLTACCPHCGLALLERNSSAVLMLVTDFLYCQVISANDATYLVASDVSSCCRPGILAFAGRDAAERFQRGFGGEIMSLMQVRHFLRYQMSVPEEA